ncbi:hypothetical protein NDU88_001080 [Pleurodeles waltl]|uniref:Uncharacterized protein n=1 Tax=Pleurodeles waltl TaxID=8319 RepID=A0AAV7S7W6_PLEWA|nr:hypothetical protein NDU88_001080 [Pleurodeles waltl]
MSPCSIGKLDAGARGAGRRGHVPGGATGRKKERRTKVDNGQAYQQRRSDSQKTLRALIQKKRAAAIKKRCLTDCFIDVWNMGSGQARQCSRNNHQTFTSATDRGRD